MEDKGLDPAVADRIGTFVVHVSEPGGARALLVDVFDGLRVVRHVLGVLRRGVISEARAPQRADDGGHG